MKKAKLTQKNIIDILTVERTGDSNSVKSKHNQNKSMITKVFDTIKSMIRFNSSLTSSILGRLYKNRMKSPTYLSVLQSYVGTRKRVKHKEISYGKMNFFSREFSIDETFYVLFRINNEPII